MKNGWLIIGAISAIAIYFLVSSLNNASFTEFRSVDMASLVLMLCWLAFIATGVFSGQGSFKTGLQNAVIWLGIVLILMAGYTFRYELQDAASTMSAGIVPPSPLSERSADGKRQTTLTRSSNGHFEAVGVVNGKRLRFLVDTGASAVVLSHGDAAAIGIDTDALSFSVPVSTANGQTMAARIRIDSLSINGIEKNNVRAMVGQPGALNGNLLGMTFMNELRGFEVRGDRMILTE